jgi:UDPglucose--hexose-1-phosphate uridylyltransferase
VRWFPNKFNFAEREGDPAVKTADGFFTYSNPYGEHEVIAETNDHSKQLHDLSQEGIRDVLQVYSSRIKELSQRNEYVVVFKNHGSSAGTSLTHSHSQVAAINIVPPQIMQEAVLGSKDDRCLYCDIIQTEKRSYRRAFENGSFVSFCPYASRFNFEIWIFPKRHINSITSFSDKEFDDCADMLKKILGKLKEIDADYNMGSTTRPREKSCTST